MWGLRVTTKTLARAQKSSSRAFHQTATAHFAITTVNVPSMGDSISEGTLVQIVKGVGEAVHADEVVAILETDKVSVDVMSPVAGTIVEHLAKLEENVEVGRALFSVDDSRAPEPGSKASSQSKGVVPAAAAPPAPTPVPAAAASAPASDASGHRTPLIKFLGKRSLLPAKSASPAQPTARSLTPVQPSGPGVLPFNHVKRVPLTPAEVAAINSGVSFL